MRSDVIAGLSVGFIVILVVAANYLISARPSAILDLPDYFITVTPSSITTTINTWVNLTITASTPNDDNLVPCNSTTYGFDVQYSTDGINWGYSHDYRPWKYKSGTWSARIKKSTYGSGTMLFTLYSASHFPDVVKTFLVTVDTGSAPPTYTLTTSVSPAGSGVISLTPSGGTYEEGTVVTVVATPNSGWQFDRWSGDASGTARTIQITMNSNKNITANFTQTLTKYTLTVNFQPFGGGTVTLTPPGEIVTSIPEIIVRRYDAGTIVNATATPASGYYFSHWSGDVSGTVASIVITMNSDKNITANFTTSPVNYNLTVYISPFESGTISLNPLPQYPIIPPPYGGAYPQGTVVTITANPNSGYQFDHWSGDASGTSPTVQITMNSNKNITANFIISGAQTYVLSTYVVGQGSVSPAGTTQYPSGTSVTITATPATGWVFDYWSGDLSGSQNPASIIMTSNKSVGAHFIQSTPDTVTLTMVSNPVSGGTIQASMAQVITATFPKGATVTITAFPNQGYNFDSWSGDVIGTSDTTSIKMDTDKIAVANFVESPWETLRKYQIEIALAAIVIAIAISVGIMARRR